MENHHFWMGKLTQITTFGWENSLKSPLLDGKTHYFYGHFQYPASLGRTQRAAPRDESLCGRLSIRCGRGSVLGDRGRDEARNGWGRNGGKNVDKKTGEDGDVV